MQCSRALSQLIFSRQSLLQNIRHTEAAIYRCFGKQLKLDFKAFIRFCIYHLTLLKLNIKGKVKFLSASNFVQSYLHQGHLLRIFREFQMQGNLIRNFFRFVILSLTQINCFPHVNPGWKVSYSCETSHKGEMSQFK